MTVTADDLHPQVTQALGTFEKMSAKERESRVSKLYAERFNDLLALSQEAMPNVDERRWPRPIPIVEAAMGPTSVEANYADIRALLAEIKAILDSGVSPMPMFTV